jgi:hypothetical protein
MVVFGFALTIMYSVTESQETSAKMSCKELIKSFTKDSAPAAKTVYDRYSKTTGNEGFEESGLRY